MSSDESNDMQQNHPDIETIEEMRNEILEDKDMEELYRLLRVEEKRMAAEHKADKQLKKFEKEQQKIFEKEEKERIREEKIKMQEERRQAKLEKAEQNRKDIIMRQEEKQKRLEEKKLAEEEAVQKRKEKALKGMHYLLNISEKYSDFFRDKLKLETEGPNKVLQDKNNLQPTVSDMKQAVTKKTKKSDSKGAIKKNADAVDVTKKLNYFNGGELRQYQIDGVQWMNTLFENGINGILADEMGLGKTIQIIALICHLMERKIPGPYLVVAPLSTIPNWESEFQRFAPSVPVFIFHGSEHEKKAQYSTLRKKYPVGEYETYPVILTTYQVPLAEMNFLSKFQWQYIIIDEGHRIKNHESRLAVNLRSLNSANRILLTGTPIHNNITELWSLLNFLMPHIFNNVDTFASLLMLEDMDDENKLLKQEEKTNLLSTLHRVLEPFVLRRLKKDVLGDNVPKKEANIYCPLSKLQRDLYTYVLNKNISMLFKMDEKAVLEPRRKKKRIVYYEAPDEDDFSDEEQKILEAEELAANQIIEKEQSHFVIRLTMGNPMMMFKKIVDHPYLVHFPLDPEAETKSLLINEELIASSGKMAVLDQMLERLKENGHKVLIFSTLVMSLDLIEEVFIMRDYTYRRLDGSHNLEQRKESIESFNNDPNILAFLLSTRSGGLGLNLVGADTVIFFDRDWNPQADIQAQDRCHRIGQTKPVMVYTLVSKGTIDEQIIETGHKKRLLEKVIIKDGKFQKVIGKKTDATKLQTELEELKKLLQDDNNHRQALASIEEMEKLLDRSELYAQMNMKYKFVRRKNKDKKENDPKPNN